MITPGEAYNIPLVNACAVYTVSKTPVYSSPGLKGEKVTEIPAWTVVHYEGLTDKSFDDEKMVRWLFVSWQDPKTLISTNGWAAQNHFERLTNEFQPNRVKNGTNLNSQDFLGEMCVAFVLGRSLQEVIEGLRVPKPDLISKIFRLRKQSLSHHQMQRLFQRFKIEPLWMVDVLLDTVVGAPVFTPLNVLKRTAKLSPLFEVWIDPLKQGRLCPQNGTGAVLLRSWVVVTKITPDGVADGWVELFNPFVNQVQRYVWYTFAESVGNPNGLAVYIT